ncbi:helix-turn-helix domain-containing protein [Actinomadura rubrisoli]|nr:helix-turn-helix transcriptional regulator [Actinomadura rubrisoli]
MLLGARLRRLREAKGLSREEAGYAIRGSHSKISRMELGRTAFKERDVADLLVLYGVTDDAERESLLRLAREGNARGWWYRYSDMIPVWMQSYLDLEEAARCVRTYDPCQIPELLQTEEYARVSLTVRDGIRAGTTQIEIEDRITVRLLRQRHFARSSNRAFTAVVDEAALRRFVGGKGLIRRQLEYLVEQGDSAGVEVRIIPVDRTSIVPVGQPFTVLRFEDQAIPDVVYMELLATALYLDKPAEADAYERAWERLAGEALPPGASRRLLTGLLETI